MGGIKEICKTATQKKEKYKMAEKLTKDKIVQAIGNLTVLELSELVKTIEEKFDVKATAPMGAVVSAPAAQAGADAGGAEKSEFNVVLDGLSDNSKKIAVIKVVREITGLGLKESKDLVEGAPKPVKENVAKAEAEELQKKLTEAGGKVTLK
jgi:large subunit ribosomal protein L7/L12